MGIKKYRAKKVGRLQNDICQLYLKARGKSLALIDRVMWVFFCRLLIQITRTYFSILNQPWIPKLISSLLECYSNCRITFASIFEDLCIDEHELLGCSFWFGFGIKVMQVSPNELGRVCPLPFSERHCSDMALFLPEMCLHILPVK